MIKFYTRWCYYCRLLSPIFDEVHEYFGVSRPDIKVARIELDTNTETKHKYQIYSFPKLAILHSKDDHIRSIFNSQRTFESIVEWVADVCPDSPQENKKEALQNEGNFNSIKQQRQKLVNHI